MENLLALFFGLLGACVMSLALYALRASGVTRAEEIRGIGSAIPTQKGGSLVPGAFIHLGGGAAVGLIYFLMGQNFIWAGVWSLLLYGAVMGIARGLMVSGFLWMAAFDQQPSVHIAKAGLGIGACHLIGQLVYGLSLSVLFGLTRIVPELSF